MKMTENNNGINGNAVAIEVLGLTKKFGDFTAVNDIDLDGKVGFPDFLVLSDNFGKTSEQQLAAVPEPASLPLNGAGAEDRSR